MSAIDSRIVVWRSVSALMQKHYGKENLTRLAKEAGIGPGSASRLKECKTSLGVELVDKLAAAFHVEAWQLMVPGFDPNNLPTLIPVTEGERALYESLLTLTKDLKTLKA